MSNISNLNLNISELFDLLSIIINGVIDLRVSDLLILIILSGFIVLIIKVIHICLCFCKDKIKCK